ncbi:MAG: gamma-glutamylcyclotransferase family protein [Nitrospinaceae bacterium]
MPNIINWFAYDEMMNPEVIKKTELEYRAAFSVSLSAHKLVFNKIPLDNGGKENLGHANIEPTPGNLGMMEGVLYEMLEENVPKLDALYGHPGEYQRRKMRFTKHDFHFVNGIVYIAQTNRTQSGLLPSKEMLKKYKGARKFLSRLYLSKLLIRPAIE